VNGSPVEVTDGVSVISHGRRMPRKDKEPSSTPAPLVPNIGIIVGDRAALGVDTGLGPRNGAIAHRVARQIVCDPPLLVTITHFHPEHGFGVQTCGCPR